MSRGAQLQISRTRTVPKPNYYIEALLGEFSQWAFDEERAPSFKGKWREHFAVSNDYPMDLEIGTGNGFYFSHRAVTCPDRLLIGIELKYKPLIQSIRRALNAGAKNARILRYNAALPSELFAVEELNDVFIHFPDPWEKLRQHKHRLIQDSFLETLFKVQRPGARLEFKTDSRDYFDWSLERFKRSSYKLEACSFDLHNSEWAASNFATHFEKIFLKRGQPIHYALLQRS